MSESNKEQTELQDIVAREASNITLEEIEQIARDDSERHAAEKKYGEILYSSIILTLTHKNYSEREAEKLWLEIRHHLYVMSTRLGRYVGVAVAAMDYLSNIVNELNSPVAISENKSTFIVATAVKDHLTGLFVRDVFQAILVKEIEKVKRTGIDLCLLMIDLDDFKKVNDNHGHIAGDEVLRQIGKTLLSHIREMDVAARYGGEELAIIMPETSIETAANVAERLRSKIELLQFDWGSVTVSIGVSHADRDVNSAEKLIKAADEALYAAKEAGKNRVVYTQS
ncbi:GGDEF domain-containing protein [Desulfogranum marinum]|uniref:GGDEF domain-containing protein n=1 Tax=Desulfogranum marinum TaxID=453220 RepID=UPI001964A94F|nr:GGDEF domain-containing protein [Desulfogranum marinum]MBM9512158.1 GGDEF domain-containing protein [Desulfogranum marinum]